jgi:DNA relaxase NicK
VKEDMKEASDALSFFNCFFHLWTETCALGRGLLGYKQGLYFPSGVKVFFDGEVGMGTHFVLGGTALNSAHLDFDVFKLVEEFRKYDIDYNISRVDIAIDCELDFSYFLNKFDRKDFACRYNMKKGSNSMRKVVNLDGRGTLYFGKRGGLTMFRIYDKAHEQGLDFDEEGNETGKIWTRIEMECKNEACAQVLEALKDGTVNQYFLGHLRFVNERCDDMSRAVTSRKYLEVLNNPMDKKKATKMTGDDSLEWFRKTCAPMEKALRRDYGDAVIDKIRADAKISKAQLGKRFNMRLIKTSDGEVVNIETGEISRLSKENASLAIEAGRNGWYGYYNEMECHCKKPGDKCPEIHKKAVI